MGFDLMRNFNLPYLALNPREFWHRWHISLSTWLRDYLYIPLGGSRRGTLRTYVNLMVTMVLGGLWHGAAWRFVLWGTLHGGALCIHRAVEPWMQRAVNPAGRWGAFAWRWTCRLAMFHLACAGWVLFRAQSLGQAAGMFATFIRAPFAGPEVAEGDLGAAFAACALVMALVQLAQHKSRDHNVVFRLPVGARAAVYFVLMLAFIMFGNYGGGAFIYFQF
jgi:D-alanyl-lipoteichoic acid acyltransferase DltB (MBOAT superfamily)